VSLDVELVIRIVVGTFLGGVIGYERDTQGRPAGLRTHLVVALAASTFTVVSTHMPYFQEYGDDDHVKIDPGHIASSVVSGIGFLAGGAILRQGLNVQGLTTAAGLWLVAAIGLTAGAGMYVASVTATVLGLVAMTVMRRFEDKDNRNVRHLHLTVTPEADSPERLSDKLRACDILATLESWCVHPADARKTLTYHVRFADGEVVTLMRVLEAEKGIVKMELDSETIVENPGSAS
jgi:putative Mg2+ transporter-C (MgtC) family protein